MNINLHQNFIDVIEFLLLSLQRPVPYRNKKQFSYLLNFNLSYTFTYKKTLIHTIVYE